MTEKIERAMSAVITFGEKIINLTESDHKAILQALMILLGSPINHSDAEVSGKDVLEFLSDVRVTDLKDYTFQVTDQVKTMTASGDQIRGLATAYSVGVITEWHVTRGGSRAGSKKNVVKLSQLG